MERYEACTELVDVFDDARIGLWKSIMLYEIGYAREDDTLIARAIENLYLVLERGNDIYARARESLKRLGLKVPSEVEKWIEEFRTQINQIILMMFQGSDPVEIEEYQLGVFERKQFDMQHKTLLKCMGYEDD